MRSLFQIFLMPFNKTTVSFKRFKFASAYLITIFVLSFVYILNREHQGILVQAAVSLISGILLDIVFCAVFEYFEKMKKYKMYFYAANLLLPFIMFLSLHVFSDDSLGSARALIVIVCLFGLLLLVPGQGGGYDFDDMLIIIIKAMSVAITYGGALCAGLWTIIYIFAALIYPDILPHVSYISVFIGLFLTALFFMGMLPSFSKSKALQQNEQTVILTRNLERLISYVLIPVVSAVTLIFIGYAMRILISRSWPSGEFSSFAVIYLAVGILLYFLTEPLETPISLAYRKFFPKIMPLVLLLLGIAVYMRVRNYSLTSNRYIVILFMVFCTCCFIVFNFFLSRHNRKIVIIAAILLSISVFPVINYRDVPAFFQTVRAQRILERNNMLESGIVNSSAIKDKTNIISKQDSTNLISAVKYLTEKNNKKFAKWLPASFTMDDFKQYFGFAHNEYDVFDYYYSRTYTLDSSNYSIAGYDISLNVQDESYVGAYTASFTGEKGNYRFELLTDSPQNKISVLLNCQDEVIFSQPLTDIYNYLKDDMNSRVSQDNAMNYNSSVIFLPFENMSVELVNGNTRMMIVFTSIFATEIIDDNGIKQVSFPSVYFNVYLKD